MNFKLLENIISLMSLKGFQFLLGFITFPYLVRVLQPEYYGLISFGNAVISYFSLIVNYGFNFIAPKEIAQHDTKEQRGEAFANIFFAKLIMLAVGSALFVIFLLIGTYCFKLDYRLYLIIFSSVIGSVLFPIWFFQGIQQMRHITIANIIARLVTVMGIFTWVKTPQDFLLAAGLQALAPFLAAGYSFYIIKKHYPEVFKLPNKAGVVEILRQGKHFFMTNTAHNVYTNCDVLFLGLLTDNATVGYFSGAKKLIDIIRQLYAPVNDAIYPHVCNKVVTSREEALKFLRKLLLYFAASVTVLSLGLVIFAPWIVQLLLGPGYEASVLLLRILTIVLFNVIISGIFGTQTLLPFNYVTEYKRSMFAGALLSLSIIVPLIYWFQAVGVALCMAIVESYITLMMGYYVRKKGLLLV